MDYTIAFTPAQLGNFIIAVCAAIVTIGGASAAVAKVVGVAKKPSDDIRERLAKVEGRLGDHDRCISSDNGRLDSIESGNRVTQRALLALLDHGLDGNSLDQMREAKDELQRHLIER